MTRPTSRSTLWTLHPWQFYILVCTALVGVFWVHTGYGATRISAMSSLITNSSDFLSPQDEGLWAELKSRAEQQPFNLVATLIFVLAITHTFFAHQFAVLAHKVERRHRAKRAALAASGARFRLDKKLETDKSFAAEMMHFLSEVEAIFAIWLIPLFGALFYFYDWHTAVDYVQSRDYTEPMFVVVIMTLAATRPIVDTAERVLARVAAIGGESPAAWWLAILTIGPLLGSFITEPAAMTLCAMVLSDRFYQLKPRKVLAYATLGLLFVNVSVGGVLTHFAAPPVLMVAKSWGWGTSHMFLHFGWKAVIGILIANCFYFSIFRKDFDKLALKQAKLEKKAANKKEGRIPIWIVLVHFCMLAWVIFNNHYPVMFVGTFLLFLAFYEATAPHQRHIILRSPILVGTFLAGLVVHGGLQAWWISPILVAVSEQALMGLAILLTAFNDNAAITYLTTLAPNFSATMKYAVVSGAVTGGGLTVIANAPNPAGQSLLSHHFEDGISPGGLFVAALLPTLIFALCFLIL